MDVEETGRKGYSRLISITSNLNRIRTASGMSQSKLAELSGVNIRMIQYYEQGQKDINKAQGDNLYRLASALGVKIEDILELNKMWSQSGREISRIFFQKNIYEISQKGIDNNEL